MFNNYFFLRQLSEALRPRLLGLTLQTCFTQSKDELLLGFCDEQHTFWVRASLMTNFNLLTFPDDYHRSRRNSMELFPEALGKRVTGLRQFENERIFCLELEEGLALYFKLFANKSNILLARDGQLIDQFQRQYEERLDLLALDHPLDQSLQAFEQGGLKACFPTLGREALRFLQENGYDALNERGQWEMARLLAEQMGSGRFYVCEWQQGVQFLLFPAGKVLFETTDPLEAANAFFQRYARAYFLDMEKVPLLRDLNTRIQRTESYLQKSWQKYEELTQGVRYREIADILMANLHQIPPRAKLVNLYDFYRDVPIDIKLNEQLSPQKNAEQYYRKAKNQKLEEQTLEANLTKKEQELQQYREHLQALEPIDHVKELRQYVKQHQLVTLKRQDEEEFPFKRFSHMGFEIWVGRNAQNSDLLTQRYAHKNDLWLHARDATGSHVIVKQQPGKNFPAPVLEYAAALAAYYSQRRNESLCPVMYTYKKFVRKPKGSPAGKVILDKESVIMVPPQAPAADA